MTAVILVKAILAFNIILLIIFFMVKIHRHTVNSTRNDDEGPEAPEEENKGD